jgi:hypothetical protein
MTKWEYTMKNKKNIYDNWTIDFREILVCICIIILGIIINVNEPKAFAVAIVVQGTSNVDDFWVYLDAKIETPLKILSAIIVLLSTIAIAVSIMVLGGESNLYDLSQNSYAVYYMLGSAVSAAFPIVLLLTDLIINLKKINLNKEKIIVHGGVENEPEL